jgi:hypothetical protein
MTLALKRTLPSVFGWHRLRLSVPVIGPRLRRDWAAMGEPGRGASKSVGCSQGRRDAAS